MIDSKIIAAAAKIAPELDSAKLELLVTTVVSHEQARVKQAERDAINRASELYLNPEKRLRTANP